MSYNEKELKAKLQEEKSNIVLPSKKETIGSLLKQKREESGKTIEFISDYLKIKPQYLIALENDEFNNLPGKAYVIGFIKSYATYLGLNTEEIINQYKAETHTPVSTPDALSISDENSMIQDPVVNTNHIFLGGVVVLFAIIFIYLSGSDNKATTENIVISEENIVIDTSVDDLIADDMANSSIVIDENAPMVDYFATNKSVQTNIASLSLEEKVEASQSGVISNDEQEISFDIVPDTKEYGLENKEDSEIRLKAIKPIWIKLKQDGFYKYDETLGDVGTGETVFEAILQPGEIYYIPEGSDYYLTIGNAQGVEIIVNENEVIAPLSSMEVSRHNIEMDVEKLQNKTAYVRNRVVE